MQYSIVEVYQLNYPESKNPFDLLHFFDFTDSERYPLVIALKPSKSIKTKLPEQCFCILHNDGKDLGVWESGFHFKSPRTKLIYMVSKRAITYKIVINDCPTRDNIMIGIEVSIVFKVVDPLNFCYKLGANNFNNYLQSLCEEQIRAMVRAVPHYSIYEMRSASTKILLDILNSQFEKFGVSFLSSTVSNVELPSEFSSTYELETKHIVEGKHLDKLSELKQLIYNNEEDVLIEKYKTIVEVKKRILENKKEKVILDTQTNIETIKLENDNKFISKEASIKSKIDKAKANSIEEISKARAEAESLLAKANIDKVKRMKEIDEWSAEELKKSEADLLIAQNYYNTICRLTEAKENVCLDKYRKQDVALSRLQTLTKLAEGGNLVFASEIGQRLIDNYVF